MSPIKKMAIFTIKRTLRPYLLSKCPEVLVVPLNNLLSDEQAVSSMIDYMYDVAQKKRPFSIESLSLLPMKAATKSLLTATPGLLDFVLRTMVAKLPGNITIPAISQMSRKRAA